VATRRAIRRAREAAAWRLLAAIDSPLSAPRPASLADSPLARAFVRAIGAGALAPPGGERAAIAAEFAAEGFTSTGATAPDERAGT